jgi:hypothetical protein
VEPQRADQPTLGDEAESGVQLLVVLREVDDVVRGLVGTKRAAVLPQVQGVEVVAPLDPEVRGRGLEEVVAEAVEVEHRTTRRPLGRGTPTHEGRDDLALAVGCESDGLGEVRLTEDVDDRLSHAWLGSLSHAPIVPHPSASGRPRGSAR